MDAHLWADRFDGLLEDVLELQHKVARSVAGIPQRTYRHSLDRTVRALNASQTYLKFSDHSVSMSLSVG
jgi:hypothetical protein